jgi:DNA-binding response OmpR family regulator
MTNAMDGKKILIVDDDKDLLLGLNIRLKAAGYDVIPVSDALSAISKAQRERPDLIILDIGLPGGSGFLVMERLSSLMPVASIPVIILTARDPHANRERALKAGAVAFLQKPVDNDELLNTLRKALEGSLEHTAEKEPHIVESTEKTVKKILIVDDDKDLLLGLNIRLKASGYNVILAADALSALSKAQQERPDLIILDIGLPGGDGFLVMERLNSPQINLTSPVIILTAKEPKTNEERALKAGAAAFLRKPVDNDELIRTIRKALGQSNRVVENGERWKKNFAS